MSNSGSTGRPKGVCVTHRNVVRLVKATNYAGLGAEEVFLQFAPISFDASTLELWGPLLNGGRLVVFPAALPSLAQLGEVIEQHQVTTLWLTAGLFHQMVEDHVDSLGSVRQLLAGGDVLSVPHVKRVLEQLDGCCLINGYGPTENTTFTTCYPMTDVSALGSSVPIGRPIANTRVYILDARLQPVPIGVAGELYTGGDGLGRGYLNRPELTAEKFIEIELFGRTERIYRSGDLARWLPDFPLAEETTVQQLVDHTAGVPHRVTEPHEEYVPRTAADMVALVTGSKPAPTTAAIADMIGLRCRSDNGFLAPDHPAARAVDVQVGIGQERVDQLPVRVPSR